tara:strand:+ start:297 stop:821 length:525 start_codon:yes stop_codon:yes gene_type:complete
MCCFFFFLLSSGQDNSATLYTLIGSQENFNFSSIGKYQDGITKLKRTRLGVDFANDGVLFNQWEITVELPLNGSGVAVGTIDSDDPLNTINIDVLELMSEDAGTNLTNDGTTVFSSWQTLTHGMVLVTSDVIPANASSHQIDISYRCGVPPKSVFGDNSDYYEIELDFVLRPVP